MTWFRIKPAEIDPEFREMFEERGVDTIRAMVPLGAFTINKRDGTPATENTLRPPMLKWLKEQYDKAERKGNWSLAMEISITILVAAELCMSIIAFVHGNSK